MRLVLASTSVYRRDLLARLEMPAALAMRLAHAKAEAVAKAHAGACVIGSDQVAELEGRPIGKPGDRERAIAQLRAMAGRAVRFHTAVCVIPGTPPGAKVLAFDDVTTVRMRALHEAEIERYVDAVRPFDVAGSFKAEGLGIALFDAIQSDDPTALIGLPLIGTARLLRHCGFALP